MSLMPKRKIERRRWKWIEGYKNLYAISNDGVINSHVGRFPKFLKKNPSKKGYLTVNLYHNKKRTCYTVHRLVAQAFILNPDNKPQVNHKDGIKTNNHYTNLEWCTAQENIIHSISLGLTPSRKGMVFSKEARQRMTDGQRKYWAKGNVPWNKGLTKDQY